MTAVARPHHSDMDLLSVDDQMDLASSPAMPTEDDDFDLDDVLEMSTEPNQDLMLQDERDQTAMDSDPIRSAKSNHVDDDIMLDEDTIIQQQNQTDLPELIMDNQQERAQVDEDDDILYEDEDLQQQAGHSEELRKEQEMEDRIDAGDQQGPPKIETSSNFKEGLQAAADTDLSGDRGTQRVGKSNKASEQLQTPSTRTDVDAISDGDGDGKTSAQTTTQGNLDEESGLRSLDDDSINDVYGQAINDEHIEADIEGNPNHDLELGIGATGVPDADLRDSKEIDNLSQPTALESDSHSLPQAGVDLATGEKVDELVLQPPLLHTVKVHYLDTEMCLFPPTEDDDSEMFFLQDVSLAHGSLDKMLGACRDVLANTIGQDDELVLDVASLGLHVSEGSSYATLITLSQIIDVYIALAHNEDVTSIEPLYCSLNSRVCLASQYAYLQSAAKEGKTLTQIVEENTFATAEDREDRNDAEDALDYERAETNAQEASAEPEDMDEPIHEKEGAGASPAYQRTPTQELTDAEMNLAARVSNHESDGGPPGSHGDVPNEDNDDSSKETEPKHEEQSASSTVKGDSNTFEGDYDNSLDLCLKPSICSCSTCANTNADDAALVSDTRDDEEFGEKLFGGTARPPRDASQLDSNKAAEQNDVDEPDIESNIQESVSSRTLEVENNQLEEDMFSQEDGQTFEDEHGNVAEDQHDDVEDFDFEEQNNGDSGLEFQNSHGVQPDNRSEQIDLDVEHPASDSKLDLSDKMGASNQVHEENQADSCTEGDDELLNFDDDEEEKDENLKNQEIALSARQPENSEDENIHSDPVVNGSTKVHDATEAYHDDASHSQNNLSLEALEPPRSQSPIVQPVDSTSAEPTQDAPNTPYGEKNGSKRKALEDEDDFDFFDTATPDKKRRRPSR